MWWVSSPWCYKNIHCYLSFIRFVGRLLLDPSTSSSSSFIIASFLIQMLRCIRFSSRFESFVFLIACGISFRWWELDLQLLPYSLLLLWVELLLLPKVYWKHSLPSGTHSLNEWIPSSLEAIQGGYHHFCILHYFFYRFKIFCILDLLILQLFSKIRLLIYVLILK